MFHVKNSHQRLGTENILGGNSKLDSPPVFPKHVFGGGGIKMSLSTQAKKMLLRSGCKCKYIDTWDSNLIILNMLKKRTQNICLMKHMSLFVYLGKLESRILSKQTRVRYHPMLLLSPEKLKRVGLESENAFNIPKTGWCFIIALSQTNHSLQPVKPCENRPRDSTSMALDITIPNGCFLKWCYPQSPPQNDHL